MEKVIRNGEVAVIYSPGYGAGWYSWHGHEQLLFHPKLVEMIEQNRHAEITGEWVEKEIGIKGLYVGCDLVIEWLPVGTRFIVEEKDGYESITCSDSRINVA